MTRDTAQSPFNANFDFAETVPPATRRMYTQARLLHDHTAVERAVDQVAIRLTVAAQDLNPVLVSILPSGLVFMGMLMRRLVFPLQATYAVNGKIVDTDTLSVQRRHIVLVDALDAQDDLEPRQQLGDALRSAGASSVQTVVLLAAARVTGEVDPDSDISFAALFYEPRTDKSETTSLEGATPLFIGCGLESGGYGANLPGIYALADSR